MMETQLAWERKGIVLNWTAVLGPEQGVAEVTDVLAWSPDGKSVAFATEGSEGGLWVFDIYTGSLTKVLAKPVVEAVWKGDGFGNSRRHPSGREWVPAADGYSNGTGTRDRRRDRFIFCCSRG